MVHFMFMFLWSNEGNVINCLLIPSSCSGTLKHHTYKQWKASATEVVLSEAEEALGAEAAWRFLPCRLITRPLFESTAAVHLVLDAEGCVVFNYNGT